MDYTRGLAIGLMIIFHLCYDLWYFNFLKVDFYGPFWEWFRYLIISIFFIVSGMSSTLSSKAGIRWSSFLKRFTQVVISALVISISTLLLFPDSWIYFGVLHFFALSMWVILPFRNSPVLALGLGISLFVLFNTTSWFNLSFVYNWLQPFLNLPSGTLDLARFIPWFGMILFGCFLAHKTTPALIKLNNNQFLNSNPVSKVLLFIGKHPLKVYLAHQPILYGAVFILYQFFR